MFKHVDMQSYKEFRIAEVIKGPHYFYHALAISTIPPVAGHGAGKAGYSGALIIAENALRVCPFEHKQEHTVNGSTSQA